ncbi:hypothetical protein WKV44_06505 [Spirochaetia bacterium 38H-sp]|uniref:WD40 repeat domain-containing protein n=1 Tax=Rarispira pelagica TaxID=3141764 RepID=A0ABU9UBZ6_9SPIR
MRKCCLLTVFFISQMFLYAFNSSIIIQTGHTGVINNIIESSDGKYIITSGVDSKIKIFSREENKIIQEILIYDSTIEYIAVNPVKTQIAVIVRRGEDYYLEIYDWLIAQKLKSIKISDRPLFIDYSPKGTYIFLSVPKWNSLRIYNTSGSLVNFNAGFGIINYMFFSKTEQTLVTYQSSSQELIYWDMKNKSKKASVRTRVKLDKPVLYSQRIMIGKANKTIYAIDLYTGEIIDSIAIDAKNILVTNNTIVVTENSSFASIILYTIEENKLKQQKKIDASSFLSDISSITCDANGYIIAGTSKGTIKMLSTKSGQQKTVLSSSMTTIKQISFSESNAFCSTSEFTLQWEASIFSDRPSDNLVEAKKIPINFTNAGIEPIEGSEKILMWSTGYPFPPRLLVYNAKENKIEKEISNLTAYVQKILITDESIVILEKDSVIRILDKTDMTEKLRIPAKGINDIASIKEHIIYAARTKTSDPPYSLIKIDTLFGETVPIETNDEIIYKILTDKIKNKIYFLNISSNPSTSVKSASINSDNGNIYSIRTLYNIAQIDSNADIIIDKDTGYIYTTVGFSSPVKIGQSEKKTFEATGHIPRKLSTFKNILYSINSDGSISMWDTITGKHIYDVYIFADGNWIIEGRNGELIPSSQEVIKERIYQLAKG